MTSRRSTTSPAPPMVKDERNLDKFDRAFAATFKGWKKSASTGAGSRGHPRRLAWKMAEKHLSAEEMAEIEALGGFEKLMETLKKRLEEQKAAIRAASKWIGTAGTSPFGAHGYNPEGVRIGQDKSRHQRAVKVWDKREFQEPRRHCRTGHPQHQGGAETPAPLGPRRRR